MEKSVLRIINTLLMQWRMLVNSYKITVFNRNKNYEESSFKTRVFS